MKPNRKSAQMVAQLIIFFCVLAFCRLIEAQAQPPINIPEGCELSELQAVPSNQQILTCIPDNFNGILIVYAHGYVEPQAPLALPFGELGDFFPVIDLLQDAGFAFGTTSYSKNGYAIEQAGENLNDLVVHFATLLPADSLKKVMVTGASEGGIIATMLVETRPDIYAGGLALCGPLAGMPFQLRYLGDFRAVFDYFFPDVFEFGIYNVPDIPLDIWENEIKNKISVAIDGDRDKAEQLFNVVRVAENTDDPAESAINLLKFSILGTGDLMATSGGKPYGNVSRRYRGSDDDEALNAGVERVAPDLSGRRYVRQFYQTTGKLNRPLVVLHTVLDDIVPFRHEPIYQFKVALQGRSRNLILIPVFRSGHCNFTPEEVFGAFFLLVLMTS